jgi:hypothetical protein
MLAAIVEQFAWASLVLAAEPIFEVDQELVSEVE